jgi:hypothetical protein
MRYIGARNLCREIVVIGILQIGTSFYAILIYYSILADTKNLIKRYIKRSQIIISADIYTANVLNSLIVSYHFAANSSILFNLKRTLGGENWSQSYL